VADTNTDSRPETTTHTVDEQLAGTAWSGRPVAGLSWSAKAACYTELHDTNYYPTICVPEQTLTCRVADLDLSAGATGTV
jgi:hypothetical protein